ncbi:hypothetical protein B0H12DRAFT_1138144 [Mycena haematopus]|nr:hypothetical protein B0H12DRAFT_1138144 [Mycena haematopus]
MRGRGGDERRRSGWWEALGRKGQGGQSGEEHANGKEGNRVEESKGGGGCEEGGGPRRGEGRRCCVARPGTGGRVRVRDAARTRARKPRDRAIGQSDGAHRCGGRMQGRVGAFNERTPKSKIQNSLFYTGYAHNLHITYKDRTHTHLLTHHPLIHRCFVWWDCGYICTGWLLLDRIQNA